MGNSGDGVHIANLSVSISVPLSRWVQIRDEIRRHDEVKARRLDMVGEGNFDEAGELLNEQDQINEQIVCMIRDAFIFDQEEVD